MEENQFREQFRELSDVILIERIKQRKEYEPLAEKAMLEEAIDRQIIANDSEKEINIAIEKFKISQPEIEQIQSINTKDSVNTFYYTLSGVFALGGILYLIKITEEPIVYIIVSIFLFSIAYYLFRIPHKRSKQPVELIKENKIKEKKKITYAVWLFIIFIIIKALWKSLSH